MVPVAALVPLPTAPLIPWLAIASSLHVVYQLVLVRSYKINDFAIAYPVARGVAPIATALLGMTWLQDRISPAGLAGIATISAGILLVALGRAIPRAGLAAAIVAGLLTTAYTLVDAHVVRMAPTSLTFVAWFFILDGLWMLSIFVLVRRSDSARLLLAEGRRGIVGGLLTVVGFGSALLALRIAPVGIVSALRETSVVFAIGIAAFILRESVDRRHAVGACVVVIGAAMIVMSTI